MITKPKVILIIATSLDGRLAFPSGGASHLGTNKDREELAKALNQVDATLFGSGTLKAHKSTFIIKNKPYNSLIRQPISILASNNNNFSKEWLYFQQPIKRWLVTKNSDFGTSKLFDKEIYFKDCWNKTLTEIGKNGIHTIALLGGAKLINSFATENLIDEIRVTIVPKILGGQYSWIPAENNNTLFRINQSWKINSIKKLSTNEILIHYAKEKKNI